MLSTGAGWQHQKAESAGQDHSKEGIQGEGRGSCSANGSLSASCHQRPQPQSGQPDTPEQSAQGGERAGSGQPSTVCLIQSPHKQSFPQVVNCQLPCCYFVNTSLFNSMLHVPNQKAATPYQVAFTGKHSCFRKPHPRRCLLSWIAVTPEHTNHAEQPPCCTQQSIMPWCVAQHCRCKSE